MICKKTISLSIQSSLCLAVLACSTKHANNQTTLGACSQGPLTPKPPVGRARTGSGSGSSVSGGSSAVARRTGSGNGHREVAASSTPNDSASGGSNFVPARTGSGSKVHSTVERPDNSLKDQANNSSDESDYEQFFDCLEFNASNDYVAIVNPHHPSTPLAEKKTLIIRAAVRKLKNWHKSLRKYTGSRNAVLLKNNQSQNQHIIELREFIKKNYEKKKKYMDEKSGPNALVNDFLLNWKAQHRYHHHA